MFLNQEKKTQSVYMKQSEKDKAKIFPNNFHPIEQSKLNNLVNILNSLFIW